MKEILVHGGHITIVDDEDYETFNIYRWHLTKKGYVRRSKNYGIVNGKKNVVGYSLHREILGVPPKTIVDHKDGNKLNNTRDNLRVATASESMCNRRKFKTSSSPYRCVTCLSNTAWSAHISKDGLRKHLGTYSTAEEAARAYDAVAREIHGEFACLNFPEDEATEYIHREYTSQHRGVFWNKKSQRWRTSISVNKKVVYVKEFDTEEDALSAYLENKIKYGSKTIRKDNGT